MNVKNSTNIDIKRLNRHNVFRYVYRNEKVSRPEIARALNMSMPTVLQNVKELLDCGLIREIGQFESTGGRKASMLARVPDTRVAVGIDITRSHIGFVLVNLTGEILHHKRVSKAFTNSVSYYEELGCLVREYVESQPYPAEKQLGAGFSIPGILDEQGLNIVDSHALGLQNLPCETITRYIPFPCHFMNDANAAGMGESRWMESGSTMVYLSLSNSVGGAVFIDGKLYKGKNQRSGEFGHMRLVPGGRRCYCGQNGCVDAYCSALVLVKEMGSQPEDFFSSLESGEKRHKKALDEYCDYLALAITNLSMSFDCNVVLGGYIGGYLEPYLPAILDRVRKHSPFEQKGTFLQTCRCRLEASAYGAAMQLVEQFMEEI